MVEKWYSLYMGKVRKLKEEVFKKIAAGEVIERPASAVKELVENSIDAGADLIEVELINGGKDLIKISDNGDGFLEEDIEMAFQSHSTSKIEKISDFDTLKTLGFRGEALPSIMEVSKIELRTSVSQEGTGSLFEFSNGRVMARDKIVFRKGTEIQVKELFYNFPVRKKFLKTERTELNRISAILENIAMINYQISFKLSNNGREIFYYGRTEFLKERVYQVIGPDLFQSLDEIKYAKGNYSLNGLVSKVNTGSSVKKHQYYFVNNRPVREASFIASVNNTYRPYLDKNKYPVSILSLNLPADEVDVNIHPMKLEIKFHNNSFIYNFIKNAIRENFGLQGDIDVESEMNFKPFTDPLSGSRSQQPSVYPDSTNLESMEQKPLINMEEAEGFTVLGQYKNSFIIIEKDTKLLIVDQHNAHERVNFDRLNEVYNAEGVKVSSPLFPIIIELTPSESRSLTQQMGEILLKIGFDIRKLSGNSLDIKTYPWFIEEKNIKDVIVSVLHLENRGKDLFVKVLGDIACKNSIKVNHRLYPDEMKKIVKELFNSSNPFFCPHNRPIIKEFSFQDVEKMVKRK